MTTTLTPSIVGQAEKTHNAVLCRALAGTTLDETQWITLVLALAAGGSVERALHRLRVAGVARFEPAAVDAAVDRLLAESLLTPEGCRLVVSPTGSEVVERVRAATNPVVARAYAAISDDDLATAGRVLTEITVRLAAELDRSPDLAAG